jgi:hypothetical protein
MRFAFADPPYYRQGKRLYGDHPEAHIWDTKEAHLELINTLHADYPDGWALACNPADLAFLLPHAGAVRVCAWTKTFHQIRVNCSVQYAWEPVLLHGGRAVLRRNPMVRDWLACVTARKKGLVGAKPDAYNDWILKLLGYDPHEDTLDDLFPGTGGMAAAIERLEAQHG